MHHNQVSLASSRSLSSTDLLVGAHICLLRPTTRHAHCTAFVYQEMLQSMRLHEEPPLDKGHAHRTGPSAAAAAALAGSATLGSGAAAARASATQDQAIAQRDVRPWQSSVVRTAGQRSSASAPRTARSVVFLPTMLVYQCTRPCTCAAQC